MAPLVPGPRVLDLGIGPGTSALEMWRADPARRHVGLDLSAPMLRRARAPRRRARPRPAARPRRRARASRSATARSTARPATASCTCSTTRRAALARGAARAPARRRRRRSSSRARGPPGSARRSRRRPAPRARDGALARDVPPPPPLRRGVAPGAPRARRPRARPRLARPLRLRRDGDRVAGRGLTRGPRPRKQARARSLGHRLRLRRHRAHRGPRRSRRLRFAGEENYRRAEDAYRAGAYPFSDLLAKVFAPITASREEIAAFARATAVLRPGFEGFLGACRAGRRPFLVVSAGLDAYIEPVLERLPAPLRAHLELRANRARIGPGGLEVSFHGADCGFCGFCKGNVVRELQAAGNKVLVCGDGTGDRHAADAADAVFARRGSSLARYCAGEALPHERVRDVRRGDGAVPPLENSPIVKCGATIGSFSRSSGVTLKPMSSAAGPMGVTKRIPNPTFARRSASRYWIGSSQRFPTSAKSATSRLPRRRSRSSAFASRNASPPSETGAARRRSACRARCSRPRRARRGAGARLGGERLAHVLLDHLLLAVAAHRRRAAEEEAARDDGARAAVERETRPPRSDSASTVARPTGRYAGRAPRELHHVRVDVRAREEPEEQPIVAARRASGPTRPRRSRTSRGAGGRSCRGSRGRRRGGARAAW